MKNIKVINVDKLNDKSRYDLVEKDIYHDKKDEFGYATYRIALSMEFEKDENTQYPLESVLNEFFIHIDEFLESKNKNEHRFIFGGQLHHIKKFKSIIGKRVTEEKYVDEDGDKMVRLIIE